MALIRTNGGKRMTASYLDFSGTNTITNANIGDYYAVSPPEGGALTFTGANIIVDNHAHLGVILIQATATTITASGNMARSMVKFTGDTFDA